MQNIYHGLNVNVRFPVLWLSIVARGRKNQSPESRLICMMSPWHDAFRAGRRKGKLNSILKMTPLATNWEVFEIRLLLQSYLVTAVQSLAAVAHFLRNVSSSWCEQINLSNHLKMKIRWIILKKKKIRTPPPFAFSLTLCGALAVTKAGLSSAERTNTRARGRGNKKQVEMSLHTLPFFPLRWLMMGNVQWLLVTGL